MQDKQARLEHLLALEALFQRPEWKDLEQELKALYSSSDGMVHSVTGANRDYYNGMCAAYNEIMKLPDAITDVIEAKKQ